MNTAEHRRLAEIVDDAGGWRRWGTYVGDRAWATVREDYSPAGDAWSFLPHDLARSKAYRWGEDGLGGWCDRYQRLVFAPAFWNRRDPILKERLFGLTGPEGNHGEDVKEYYFYVDNLPSHAYARFLYKYPQAEFPYAWLVEENGRRGPHEFEFELLDTGVFDQDRYWDVELEYAKGAVDDTCIRLRCTNRGPEPAPLDILPTLWFRNTWAWSGRSEPQPRVWLAPPRADCVQLLATDDGVPMDGGAPESGRLGRLAFYAPLGGLPLFTNNDTNGPRVFGSGHSSHSSYVKDAFHRRVIHGEDCVNPAGEGTKAAIWYRREQVPPGETVECCLRLTDRLDEGDPLSAVAPTIALRRQEADEYYAALHPAGATADERLVQRQAWAGLLWTKQAYLFDVNLWLHGDDPFAPPPAARRTIRNQHWEFLNSHRVMTVCDKWEYPWFAAWDLAFQCVALATIDPQYAMDQLWILLFEQFQHPSGQIPAYEWEFSDLNPPVHAWAVWRVFNMVRHRTGQAPREFLERCFHKLLMNFAFWVNRVDRDGNNVFEGGFLGLDNIAAFDRSLPLPEGLHLEQCDASGWMGMFCLNLMRIALELARENRVYESLATKFFQHYTYLAQAMKQRGPRDYALWDEEDGFFYDVLRRRDGGFRKLRVRSLVGLIPLFCVERLEEDWIAPFADFRTSFEWFLRHRPEAVRDVVHTVRRDGRTTHVLTIVDQRQLARLLYRAWDPQEFLSPYGIRSLSRAHAAAPFECEGVSVGYEPAEAITKIKGGNSNWRGPVWLPTCFLLIESLRKLAKAFGPELHVDCPAGRPRADGRPALSFPQMARDLADRLIGIYTRDASGRRPLYGGVQKFQDDPHWRDLLLFYEYYHGENGAGLGASHQTGWSALVASLIDEWRTEV